MVVKGAILRARRVEKGMTQADLAEATGLSINTISTYEAKSSRANIANVRLLANYLDLGLMDLCEDPTILTSEAPKVQEKEALNCTQNPVLRISDRADEPLKMAASELVLEEGSKDRVSRAIASITGYLRIAIQYTSELKMHSHGLVDAITATLSSAALDPDHTSIEDLWSVIKNGLAELKELDHLPEQAKQEADSIISQLQQARLENDDTQRLRAVKSTLYWLHDYWNSICTEQSAYNALSGVSCAMTSAPTDYATRARLVAHINTFAAYVAMYDPIYREIHKGEGNE